MPSMKVLDAEVFLASVGGSEFIWASISTSRSRLKLALIPCRFHDCSSVITIHP